MLDCYKAETGKYAKHINIVKSMLDCYKAETGKYGKYINIV